MKIKENRGIKKCMCKRSFVLYLSFTNDKERNWEMKNTNLVNKEKNSKGITLVALVISIIILLILATVSVNLVINSGIITKSAEAVFRTEIEQYIEELELAIAEESLNDLEIRDSKFNIRRSSYNDENSFTDAMKDIIPSFNKKYANKLEIQEDKLTYIGEDEQERTWLPQTISVARMLKISYQYENGTPAATPYQKVITDGSYKVESPTIDGYKPDRQIVCGEIKGDTNVIVTYYLPSQGLAYKGLDSSGNETDVEENIVAYTISGIGTFAGENLVIPEKYDDKPIIKIKGRAFENCTTIKKAVIPNHIQSTGGYIFYNSNIEYVSIDVEEFKVYNTVLAGAPKLKEVEFGKNVKLISGQTVQSKKVEKIIIHSENVTGITGYSFDGCTNLKEIIISESNESYKTIDGILYSKDEKELVAFPSGRTEEFIPSDNIEIIGDRAFWGNTLLKTVNITPNIKKIGDTVFYNCTNLKIINIDNGVNEIGNNIFYNCKNVEQVNYNGKIEEWNRINKKSWKGNSNITQVICSDGIVDV